MNQSLKKNIPVLMIADSNCESESIQKKFFHLFVGIVQAVVQVVTIDELLNNN